MKPWLTLVDVSKQFSDKKVFSNLSLQLFENSTVAILGKNGCGKSTLLNILAGVMKPSRGSRNLSEAASGSMTMLGQTSMFYPLMNAEDNLLFFYQLHKRLFDKKLLLNEIRQVLAFCGLKNFHIPIENFSKGMLQRLGIARIILSRSQYIFLDEPFTSLDLNGQELLQKIIEKKGLEEFSWSANSLVIIDHDIRRILPYCDQIYFGEEGRFENYTKSAQLLEHLETKLYAR